MPTVSANGATFHYELHGPAGEPVLAFVHALGATADMWREQVAAFAGPYRCLTYDAVGHGETPERPTSATIEALADDLASLLDALAFASVALVGASIGGMTAQSFAARHPDRVDRLILLSTTARMPDAAPWAERAASVRANGLDALATATMSPRWFTPAFAAMRPDRVEETRSRFVATDREAYARCAEAVGSMDLRDAAASITAPTLIIVGADDPGTPIAMAADLRARIPNATLAVLPNAAHMVPIECADAVSAAMASFLRLQRLPATPSGPATFSDGIANRRAVLGDHYVDRALEGSGNFGAPWQDYVTRVAWGEAWGDPSIDWRTRSLLTLALLATLGREDEFRLHVHGALRNGVTRPELQGLLRHVAAYAGAAAGNNANRWAVAEIGSD